MNEIELNIRALPIRDIDRTKTQTRVILDRETVADYAERMKAGDEFPKPIVYFAGEQFWLGDGFHRVAAAELNGDETIDCEIRTGGYLDALKHALTANAKHGLRRTNADKRNAIYIVLEIEEWRNLSDRAIAEMCGVDHKTVAAVREDEAAFQAREAEYHARKACQSTGGIPQLEPEKRLGQDGKWRQLPQRPAPAEPEADDEPANIQQIELEDEDEGWGAPDPLTPKDPAESFKAHRATKQADVKSGTELISTKLKKEALSVLGDTRRVLGKVGLIASELRKTKGDDEVEDALELLFVKVMALVVEPDAAEDEQRPATRHSTAA